MHKILLILLAVILILIIATVAYFMLRVKNGIYYIDGGDGYRNGWTLGESKDIAKKYGGVVASKEQLMKAFKLGYSRCSYGWLTNGEAGLVLKTASSNCGPVGYSNSGFGSSGKFGIWGYGAIPDGFDGILL